MNKKSRVLLSIALFLFSYALGFGQRKVIMQRLDQQIGDVKQFLRKNPKYSDKIAFFIDMKVFSGNNRFFVVDMVFYRILHEGLVAHGSGNEEDETSGEIRFGNEIESYRSSLGKYSIGYAYKGEYGKAYKLYGLDSTNSNAFKRNVVLHKYKDVPETPQDEEIVLSLGCPMVSFNFFKKLEKLIDRAGKPVIMLMYF